MATHESARKQHRQSLARRERNRQHRKRLRTTLKKFRRAVADGDVELARSLLPRSLSLLDRTRKHGAIHANVAARTKSRLSRALNRIAAAG